MKVTFSVKGLKELDEALARLPKGYAKNVLRKAWAEASAPLVADIKANAPVDTGALRDSIRVERMGGEAKDEVKMQIGVFGEFYGHFQEFGTSRQPARPFVRPAIDRHAAGLVERFRKIVGESIERAAARAAARQDAKEREENWSRLMQGIGDIAKKSIDMPGHPAFNGRPKK